MKYAPLIIAILLAVILRLFFISIYKAPSHSMAPAVLQGDHIFASQLSYGYKSSFNNKTYFSMAPDIGDLVIYIKNTRAIIKRVVAKPGDTVEYAFNQLTINSVPCTYEVISVYESDSIENVKEVCGSYPAQSILRSILPLGSNAQNIASTKLEEGQYLLAGDNRNFDGGLQALDIAGADQIVGKPLFVWMSYSSTRDFISPTLGMRWNRILTNIK